MTVWPCNRTGPIQEVLFTEEEQYNAVVEVHSTLDKLTLGNCHSAVAGTGGTARANTKVAIMRALKKSQGKGAQGGTLFDVGCGFGHFMLAALKTGFSGACGCELPDNEVQRGVCYEAKARLGISPDDLCEWIGSDVTKLDLPEHLRRRITAVYSFWCGIGPEAQRRTLDLCRDTLVNVRSVAVYLAKGWTTPKHGMAAFVSMIIIKLYPFKTDRVVFNQFLRFSIKGHPHQPGCFTKPSVTPVWETERSTQHGSFIGKLKQSERGNHSPGLPPRAEGRSQPLPIPRPQSSFIPTPRPAQLPFPLLHCAPALAPATAPRNRARTAGHPVLPPLPSLRLEGRSRLPAPLPPMPTGRGIFTIPVNEL